MGSNIVPSGEIRPFVPWPERKGRKWERSRGKKNREEGSKG